MATIKVVCGIIFDKGKIFICRRKKGKSLEGFWEFPGGKIEDNEKHEDSLKRELIEELNMQVNIRGYFETSVHNYYDVNIELIAFTCDLIKWNNYLSDHDLFKWISPEEITNLKLAPADIPIAKKLLSIKN